MGSERASTTRQRLAGKICCYCRLPLPPPHFRGEKCCKSCDPRKHRIYMHFMKLAEGWHCQFLEADLKTPLRKRLNLTSPEKIREAARRGGSVMDLDWNYTFEAAIQMGRGSVWLNLTEEQYRKLL